MFRSIRRKLFGRPKNEHWAVADFIADPPGFNDLSHPLTMGYIQMDSRVDSPGRIFVEEHLEEVRKGIEEALTFSDQKTRIKLCNIFSKIDPHQACDHLVSMICTEALVENNKVHALQLICALVSAEGFVNSDQQQQLLRCLLPYLEKVGSSQRYTAMDILFCMTISEAVETAHIYLTDPHFGEECGLYLAKFGDPAGWPALRRLIADVNLGVADPEYAWVDIRDGLNGLAGWIDNQINELTRQTMQDGRQGHQAGDAPSRFHALTLLSGLARLEPQGFYSNNTLKTLSEVDMLLNNYPKDNASRKVRN